MAPGEERAWEILAGLDPEEVCRNGLVHFSQDDRSYSITSLGTEVALSAEGKTISGREGGGDALINRLGYFSRLVFLWYLIGARPLPLSDKLVNPVNLKGGQLFFRGTHVLPLDKIAGKYATDPQGFLRRCEELGGERLNYGDASARLSPLPRVPVVIILWREDEEFPARVDLLFDESCESHLPLDMLWSTAMMTLLLF